MNPSSNFLLPNYEEVLESQRQIQINNPVQLKVQESLSAHLLIKLFSSLFQSIFTYFKQPLALWYLFLSIIHQVLHIDPELPVVLILFSACLINLTIDLSVDIPGFFSDKQAEKTKVLSWSENRFIQIEKKDLVSGQFLLIKQNEEVPADVLLIANGNIDRVSHFDTLKVTGQTELQKKTAVKQIQALIDSNEVNDAGFYLNTIEGTLVLSEPSKEFHRIEGKIKLRSDPKSIKIDINSVALAGSVLKFSPWVFALVLYSGTETKISKNMKKKKKIKSKLEKISQKFQIFSIFFVILASFVNFLANLSRTEDLSFKDFCLLISLYTFFIPMPLLFIFPVSGLVQCLLLHCKNHRFSIPYPSILESLGGLDYLLFTRNSLIQSSVPKVRALLIDYSLYLIDTEVKTESSEATNLLVTEPGSALESLRKNVEDSKIEYFHFVRALALCTKTYIQGIQTPAVPGSQTYDQDSFFAGQDSALINLASDIGLSVIHRDSKKIILSHNSIDYEYKILALRSSADPSNKLRVLLENVKTREFVYYLRGSWESMSELANSQVTRYIEKLWLTDPGIRILAYASLSLSLKQVEKFLHNYSNARKTPINKDGRIQALFEELDTKVSWLGFAGVEDRILRTDVDAVNQFKSAGIKLWLASGDSEEWTFSTGLCSDIIDKDYEIVRIPQADSSEELNCLLQDHLKRFVFMDNFRLSSNISNSSEGSLKEEPHSRGSLQSKQRESLLSLQSLRRTSVHPLITHISNKPSSDFSVSKPFSSDLSTFVLTLNGKSLELALKTSESLKLLVLLLFVAKSVCFYEMSPQHLRLLHKIMKKCLSFRPAFASLGDGIGIRLNSSTSWSQTSDFELAGRSVVDLKDLILHRGLNLYVKFSKVLKLAVFVNAGLGGVLFLNCYFSGFSSFWVLSEPSVYFLVFAVQVLVFVNQISAEDLVEKDLLGQYRQVYLTGTLAQEASFSILLVFALAGFVLGIIQFVLMVLTFAWAVDENGRSFGTSEIEMFLLTVLAVAMQICMLVDCQKITVRTVVVVFFSILVFFSYLIILNSTSLKYLQSLRLLFESPALVLSLVMCVIVEATAFYALLRWKELFRPTLLDHYRCTQAYFSVLEFISRQGQYEEDLGKVYSSNTLAESISLTSENPLNKYSLVFRSENKESEFNKEKIAAYRRTYRFNFLTYFAITGSLFLFTGIVKKTENWQRGLLFFSVFSLLGCFLMILTRLYQKFSLQFIGFLFISGVFYTILGIILQYDTFSTSFSLYPLIFMISCTHWLRFTAPLSLLLLILDVQFKTRVLSSDSDLVSYALSETSIVLVSILCSYLLDYHKRQEFLLVSQVSLKTSKANDVLKLLLPSFVINKVKTGIYYISIDQGIVSVLFCNICNFEELTSDLTPLELTSFLDELYSKFDQLCEIVGVTKIETVGKTYMASAGIKDSDMELDSYLSSISHARRLVELALGMIRAVQKTQLKGSRVHIKIGINSGPVRAGVVGFHKPQFSLVGDTVNIASRMASTLTEYDSIQVTHETYEIIKESPELAFISQSSFVKGKGEMSTFIVKVAADNSSSELSSIGDTYGSGLKGQYLSCKISTSYLSLSAAYSGELVMRSSFSKKSRLSAQWKKKSTLHKKTSQVISKLRFFPCSSKARRKEQKFRIRNLEKKVKNFYIALIVSVFCYSGILIAEAIYVANSHGNSISLAVCVLVIFSYSAVLPLVQRFYKTVWFSCLYSFLVFVPIVLHLLSDVYDSASSTIVTSLKISFHILLLTQCSSLKYSENLVVSLSILLILILHQVSRPSLTTVITFLFLFLSQVSCYTNEVKLRIYSKLQSSSQKELSKLENLLTQMVPPHAYEHLKAENSVIDKFYQVTLLYADIVGFTAWSSSREPAEVVTMLNEMFTRFDKMCVSHSVYKVHTIGDCYVAMGNAGSGNRDIGQECVNVLQFAHAMISTIQQVNQEYSMGINMRIGIHTGDVIAGITGKSIVRYDIYGNDVFIANSMESNGLPGQVAVSKTTMNLVKNFRPSLLSFESHKTVEVFGEDIEIFFARFN